MRWLWAEDNPCKKTSHVVGRSCRGKKYLEKPWFLYRFTKDSNVAPAEVSKNGRILLANLLQSSRSTFSCVRFPSFFAFQEGMLGTQISALLSSPTVSGRFLRQLYACFAPCMVLINQGYRYFLDPLFAGFQSMMVHCAPRSPHTPIGSPRPRGTGASGGSSSRAPWRS